MTAPWLSIDELTDWLEPFVDVKLLPPTSELLTIRCEHPGRWLLQLWSEIGSASALWTEVYTTSIEAMAEALTK